MDILLSVWLLLMLIALIVGAFIVNWIIGLIILFMSLPLLVIAIYGLKEGL